MQHPTRKIVARERIPGEPVYLTYLLDCGYRVHRRINSTKRKAMCFECPPTGRT